MLGGGYTLSAAGSGRGQQRGWRKARPGLEPALASLPAQRGGENGGIDPGLELGKPLAPPLRLSVDGVLESLDDLLQVRNPRFQSLQPGRIRIRGGDRRGFFSRGGCATYLPDSGDQPLPISACAHRTPAG